MIQFALIRHGPTDWNEARLIQGHADRSLSEAGRRAVANWVLPEELETFEWFVSPLKRARETAALLGVKPTAEHALTEMDWGDWEGLNSGQIRARFGEEEFKRRTGMGLDLRPHGGESPRELRARVFAWLLARRETGTATGAVCHQGVIRAILSLATGWEMIDKPPVRLEWAAAQLFAIDERGTVTLQRANLMLDGS